MEFNLKLGLQGQATEKVSAENTAERYGSGGVAVYATPAMIGLMEKAALLAVDPLLPEGWATVGTHLDVKHLAATPIGMQVTAKAELKEMEGRRLVFSVQAFDEVEKIGEGTHERFLIQVAKFLAKNEEKKTKI
ncbi:MAG: thioesterase family protein [Spirochaetales bacterium]